MIRVVGTIWLIFHPGLLDLVSLTTERANEPSPVPGWQPQHHAWPYGADTSLGYWHTPDHSQGMQPDYLTHKPLCAPSTSTWWLTPSHTYYNGNFSPRCTLHLYHQMVVGLGKTSHTPDSLSYLWQQQEVGMGYL